MSAVSIPFSQSKRYFTLEVLEQVWTNWAKISPLKLLFWSGGWVVGWVGGWVAGLNGNITNSAPTWLG